MKAPTEMVTAGHFKTSCLKLLDEVASDGKEFVVTKHGKPVARLVPLAAQQHARRIPPRSLKGSVVRYELPDEPVFDPWP